MAFKLQDLIDIEQFQMLQDRLNEIYSFPSAIIDNESKVLTATAWQDICTKFHRQNSECEKECIKSDQYIADHLHEANPAVSYRCPHGLIDNATPIIIDGIHYGNYFTGQFFLEPPDLNFFREQAKRYGFDEEAYIEAVKKVPIWTQEQLNSYLFFIKGLIEVIASTGLKNLKDIEAGKKIEESEERHRTILKTAMDGIWLVDMQGRLLEVNETYCRMSGYSEQELLVMRIPDLEIVEKGNDTDAHIQKIMAQGEDRFESRHRGKDGSVFDVEVSVQYRSTGDGQMIAFLRDITERKRVEEKLVAGHKLLSNLASLVPGVIYQYRLYPDGRSAFPYASQAMNDIYEVTPEEVREDATPVFGRLHPDDHDRVAADIFESARTLETFYCEFRVILPRQGLRWRWSQAQPQRLDDGSTLWHGIISDITERKQVESALQESEKKYRLIAENTADLISILDMNLCFTYVSPATVRLRGFTVEEAMSQTLEQVLTPESLRIGLALFEKEMQMEASGEADPDRTLILELEEYKKDGSTVWMEVSLSFLRDKDRKPVEILIVSRDINDRKRAEVERQNLQERLQRAEKMEALGQLAGGVAHDLNNVLGILSGYSELLLEEIPEESRSRGHVEKILQSTQKGAAIIEDLLTLARRGVTVSDVINLNSIVSDFLETPVFDKFKDYHPRVTFRTECDNNLLNIKGSPVHLEKTLMNLVSNAAEAITEEGEVTIWTENRYLDKPIKGYDEIKEGDYAVLTVSDTGVGISTENREKIFEPFYTKKKMGRSGTGLGLAIVWGTVKDHNGYIDVQTEVGKGTTFTLYFPVTREELTAQQRTEPIEQYMGKGESVLVVDDIAEQREIASKLLTRLGYAVHLVSSGEEAVEYLKGHKADILVLDMIMTPGIDGLETYQRVLEINPKQKAILVSGFSETHRAREAQKLGAGTYIKKPYVLEKIGVAIRDELAKKR